MRAITGSVGALVLCLLLAAGAVTSAQSSQPDTQLLTPDEVSATFEGLWEGACSSFGDTTTCNFQEDGTTSKVDLVVRVPVAGTGASAQSLESWRASIENTASNAGLTIQEAPEVGDAAVALLGPDGSAQRLEFYVGGTTGSVISKLDRPVAGRDLGGLARYAIPRLGSPSLTPGPATESPAAIVVPTFTGTQMVDAQALADSLGLVLRVRTDETSDLPVGTILSQEPAPGTAARTGDVVSIIVAAAASVATPGPTAPPATPEPATIPTPSFTGMTMNEARALAISVGVNLSPTFDGTSDQPDETVLSQSPEPGTPIAPESFVDIVVARASAGPAPTPFVSPTPPPAAAPVQVAGPSDISLDPVVIVTSAAAAAGIVLLIPFPSALFNSTLEEHYAEIRGWFRFRRRKQSADEGMTGARPGELTRGEASTTEPADVTDEATVSDPPEAGVAGAAADPTGSPDAPESPTALIPGIGATIDRFWSTRAGIASFFVIAGLLYGFLDPSFGFSADSVLLFIGILGALVIGSLVATGTFRWARERLNGERGTFRVLPATLIIALVCVLVTRITDFQPGYLYGILAGLLFATTISEKASGREHAITSSVVAGVGVLAFVVLGIVRALEGSGGATGLWRPIDVTLSALVIGGFEGLLFGMLPLTGLPGAKVKEWDTRVWALLLFLGAALFLHVIVNPSSGYLVDSTTVPLVKALALLIAFGGLSVGLWAWFRYRPMDRLRGDGHVLAIDEATPPTEADVPPPAPGD